MDLERNLMLSHTDGLGHEGVVGAVVGGIGSKLSSLKEDIKGIITSADSKFIVRLYK